MRFLLWAKLLGEWEYLGDFAPGEPTTWQMFLCRLSCIDYHFEIVTMR